LQPLDRALRRLVGIDRQLDGQRCQTFDQHLRQLGQQIRQTPFQAQRGLTRHFAHRLQIRFLRFQGPLLLRHLGPAFTQIANPDRQVGHLLLEHRRTGPQRFLLGDPLGLRRRNQLPRLHPLIQSLAHIVERPDRGLAECQTPDPCQPHRKPQPSHRHHLQPPP